MTINWLWTIFDVDYWFSLFTAVIDGSTETRRMKSLVSECACVWACECACACVWACEYVCGCVCVYVCVGACVCVRVCVCMGVWVCECDYGTGVCAWISVFLYECLCVVLRGQITSASYLINWMQDMLFFSGVSGDLATVLYCLVENILFNIINFILFSTGKYKIMWL